MTRGPARIYPASNLEQTRGEDWRTEASCAGLASDESDAIFYGGKGETPKWSRAKAHCAECPVKMLCVEAALVEEDADGRAFGFRGGLTAEERMTAIRRRWSPKRRARADAKAAAMRKAHQREREAADADR